LRRVSEFWASGLSSVAVLVLFEELVLFEPPEALLIEAAELALAAWKKLIIKTILLESFERAYGRAG
jgi:hypothetical protein